jgi:hypothetical protein
MAVVGKDVGTEALGESGGVDIPKNWAFVRSEYRGMGNLSRFARTENDSFADANSTAADAAMRPDADMTVG